MHKAVASWKMWAYSVIHLGINGGTDCQIKRLQHSPCPSRGVGTPSILSPLCVLKQERGEGFLPCQTERKTKVSFAALSGPRLVICHSSSDTQRRGIKLGPCVSRRQCRQRLQTSRRRLTSPGPGRWAPVCVLSRWPRRTQETPVSNSLLPRYLRHPRCFKSSKS